MMVTSRIAKLATLLWEEECDKTLLPLHETSKAKYVRDYVYHNQLATASAYGRRWRRYVDILEHTRLATELCNNISGCID
jgi:hypothetical protein